MKQFYQSFRIYGCFLCVLLFAGISANAQLSGNYTINKGSAASGTNYQSFSAFFSDLNSGSRADAGTANGPGVNGAVTVTVVKGSGPYTEQVNIGTVTGVSSTNTITVKGNMETVQYSSSSSSSSYVFRINGTDYLTFDSLKVSGLGSSYARCFHFMNSADYNTVSNCVITMPNMSSTSNYNAFISITQGTTSPTSYGDPGEYITIKNNIMSSSTGNGPYAGIMIVNERSGSTVHKYDISNNEIRDFYYAGLYGYYLLEANINGNEIHNTGNSRSGYKYGLYMYNYYKGGNHQITNNYFHDFSSSSNSYQYGVYNYAYYGTGNNGINISGNRFVFKNRDYYTYAIRNYCYRASISGTNKLNNNYVHIDYNASNYYTQYGIYNYMYYATGFSNFEVSGNEVNIESERYAYAIYNYGYYASFSKTSVVANNLLNLQANYYTYGIYNYLRFVTTEVQVAFNTIYTRHYKSGTSSGNKYMLYCYYVDDLVVKNNIFYPEDNGGNVYAMYVPYSGLEIDNNNLYLDNATANMYYGYDGSNYTSFNDYQKNMGGKNDMSLNPKFVDIAKRDFTPTAFKMVNKGTPLSTVTNDINGTTRNATNPDLGAIEFFIDIAVKHFSFNGSNECGNYKEYVTVTVKNNNTIELEDVPMAFDINGIVKVMDVVDSKIAAGDSLSFTFEKPAVFNFPGNNTLSVYLDGSDDNKANNEQNASVFITSAPFGGEILETSGYPGYFRQGNSGGLMSNPDVTVPGLEITYDIQNPTGYTNATYGTDFTMQAYVKTSNGMTVTNGVTYTAPTSTTAGSIAFNPATNLQDSLVFVGIMVNSKKTGCDSVFGRYVYVPHVPMVDFEFKDVCDGDVIEFRNTSTLAKGLMLYDWQFNDPNSTEDFAEVSDPVYKYNTFGSYDVDLHVMLSAYPKFVFTKSQKITVTPVPTIDFKVFNACEGEDILIKNNSSLPAGITGTIDYAWDFGDGNTSTLKEPKHRYAMAGGYQITLKATSNGCSSNLIKNANQFARPKASFTTAGTCNLEEINFTNNTTISIGNSGFIWDFGDNNISNLRNPKHIFTTPGAKTVKLTAISEFGCTNDYAVTFNLAESPKADFSFSDPCNLTAIKFTRGGTLPAGVNSIYEWDFNGEATSTNENPSHLFNTLGLKDVSLIVRSANGCSDHVTKSFAVKLQAKADFSAKDICEDEEVSFTNSSTVAAGNLFYEWRFGDGSTSAKTSPKHGYNISGNSKTFLVTLVASIPGGCSDSVTRPVTVNAKADAGFTAGVQGRTVSFSQNTTDASNNYNWRFGDGGKTNAINPVYVYDNVDLGDFEVCLGIINAAGCISESCEKVTINLVGVDNASKSDVAVYPNPAATTVYITAQNQIEKIEFISLSGKSVLTIPGNGNGMQADIQSLAAGVYLVKTTTAQGTGIQRISVKH